MPDYQNGKIYKLWSPEGDDIYIGSTTLPLSQRKAKHKNTKHASSKILFEKYNDVRIELLECYPCNNKEELTRKEGEYIRNNNCVNRQVAGRTRKEYNQDNIEKIKEYYQDNIEKIKEKQKEYYQENKEKNKEYREKNKEKIKERDRKYYQENKEKIKERSKIRIICECGINVNKDTIARHRRTEKHKSILEGLK